MARLVHRREQRLAEVALVDAGRDPPIAHRALRAERMMRRVEPSSLQVVAYPLGNGAAELELSGFAELAAQAAIICWRPLGYRVHHRHEVAPQSVEERADRRCGHALVGVIDQWIGDMVVG